MTKEEMERIVRKWARFSSVYGMGKYCTCMARCTEDISWCCGCGKEIQR